VWAGSGATAAGDEAPVGTVDAASANRSAR
jgi:hypothetical protein